MSRRILKELEVIGRESFHFGRTLPEICLRLPNHGIGRLFTRFLWFKYPEKSFIKLKKFQPSFNSLTRFPRIQEEQKDFVELEQTYPEVEDIPNDGKYLTDQIFRNELKKNVEITNGNCADWMLIPKDEEQQWFYQIDKNVKKNNPIPQTLPIPPLLVHQYEMCRKDLTEEELEKLNWKKEKKYEMEFIPYERKE
ncbi:hypothetical protein SNEBB_006009 [Seison nebaliae]|nr:hypothetical protein SNEBB_006009 [Seison nebaliae]